MAVEHFANADLASYLLPSSSKYTSALPIEAAIMDGTVWTTEQQYHGLTLFQLEPLLTGGKALCVCYPAYFPSSVQ